MTNLSTLWPDLSNFMLGVILCRNCPPMYSFNYRMFTHKITSKIRMGLEIYIRVLTFSWDWDISKVFGEFLEFFRECMSNFLKKKSH